MNAAAKLLRFYGPVSDGHAGVYGTFGETQSSHSSFVIFAVSLPQSSSRHVDGPGHLIQPSTPLDMMM